MKNGTPQPLCLCLIGSTLGTLHGLLLFPSSFAAATHSEVGAEATMQGLLRASWALLW